MFHLALSVAVASVIIFLIEWLARKKLINSELSRKLPHTIIASTIALWPFFVAMRTVAWLGILFTLFAFLVHTLNLFPHSRAVGRKSWGEALFGLGITGAALLSPNRWVFAAALLYLGVADAVAALVGLAHGKRKYKVFGYTKTLEGSLAFVGSAVLITGWVVLVAPAGLERAWPAIILVPIVAGLIEAVSPLGLDNLLLPVFVAATLGALQAAG